MRFLSLSEVVELHRMILAQSGSVSGIRDLNGLLSALAQPRMTFEGVDLYPDLEQKAAALCFSLVSNHAFVDGNKRIGHAAMETFLVLNGWELQASVDEAEHVILAVASGEMTRKQFTAWVKQHTTHR